MKKKIKYIAIFLSLCILSSFLIFSHYKFNRTVYAVVEETLDTSKEKISWSEITEEDYVKALAKKYNISLEEAKYKNLKNTYENVPEILFKSSNDMYEPRIVYRTLKISSKTVFNTTIEVVIVAKVLEKGTYSYGRYKKFLDVIGKESTANGMLSAEWNQKIFETKIINDSNQGNDLWVYLYGQLFYEVDQKMAAKLEAEGFVKTSISVEESKTLKYSKSFEIEKTISSND